MGINELFRHLNIGLPEDIARRKSQGDLEGAIRLMDLWLARNDIPEALRGCLTVQREMTSRLSLDYPYTRAEALALVRKHIPDFTEEEFDHRVDLGQIGWIYLNGEMRFFDRFFASVCKAQPSVAQRAGIVMAGAEASTVDHLAHAITCMKEQGSYTNRIRIRASAQLKDELFTPGMFLRVHLPLPARCEQQSDIRIESISPPGAIIAPEDAPQRTICWEITLEENLPFVVEYSYLHTANYHDFAPVAEPEEDFAPCLKEEHPHIVFTPYIKALTEELIQGISDPLDQARSIYDFISLNMKYNFMPAYFSLENIAENCARNFSGDCGVFALLFLTMCRCAGIPAQWQSGLAAEPGFCGGHDWVRFYARGYGWLYADPSYGTAAVRRGDEARRKFYFGNLDPYRMVANRVFQAEFTPEKVHWRADPYDNQVGEMELADRGLRYDEFIRSKEVLLCEEEPTCPSKH